MSNSIYLCSGGTEPSSGYTPNLNEWHHLAFTADGINKKLYIDGELVHTTIDGTTILSSTNLSLGCRSASGNNSSGTYFWAGKLNDFRLYDHCLSPMEVKELSKGLCLHYLLDNGGWGGENLDNFSSVTSNWTMESLTGSNYTDPSHGNVIKLVTNAANQRMYHNVTNLWQSNQVYAVSFLAKSDQNGTTCDMSRSIADFSPTFTLTTRWKRYSGKITSTATPGGGTLSFRINQSGATVYITQIKLEKGEFSTPWSPAPSDSLYTSLGVGGTTEYDASGFCNNGTKSGSFSYSGDSPKYGASTHFNGNNYISLTSPNTEIRTLSLWVKFKTISSYQNVIFVDGKSHLGLGLYSGGILTGTSGPGSYNSFDKTQLITNKWYHFVVVNDGTINGTTRKLYINGVLQTTNGNASNWSYGIDELQLGRRVSTTDGFDGELSDLRLYATALSAADIKSLYNNNAYIDSANNIYGQIRS